MNNAYSIALIIFTLAIYCTWNKSFGGEVKIKGYYLTLNNDTIHVFIELDRDDNDDIDFMKLQRRLLIYRTSDSLRRIRPHQVKEFGFKYGDDFIKMRSVYNTLWIGSPFNINRHLFIRVIASGKDIFLYKYYIYRKGGSTRGLGGMIYNSEPVEREIKILQRTNNSLIKVKDFFFRKQMRKYFKTCLELVDKIDSGNYYWDTVDRLVNDYSKLCK